MCQVHFEGAVVGPEQLVAAVDDCGFDCRLQSVHNVDTDDADSNRLQVRWVARCQPAGGCRQQACTAAGEAGATAAGAEAAGVCRGLLVLAPSQ